MHPNPTTIICANCGVEVRIKPSRLGRTRYCSRVCKRAGQSSTPAALWRRTVPNGECLEYTGKIGAFGYGDIKYHGRTVRAHRLAYELTYGPIADEAMVLHSCDNPRCVNPAHLFLGTQQVNMDDMVAKGRQSRGTRHGSRTHPDRIPRGERNGGGGKLNAVQAREIRARRATGEMVVPLGREYGVTPTLISQICLGKVWRHLD